MAWTTAITPKRTGSVTLTPSSLATTVQNDQSVTITGLTTDDNIAFKMTALEAGIIVGHVWVSAANTAKVRLYNPTGSTITPASQTWDYVVF